jgi:hypothetical protein
VTSWPSPQLGILQAAGQLIGYLFAQGTPFDHPSGMGDTTTLCLRLPGRDLLVQPGQWLVHAGGDHWQTVDNQTFAGGRP